MEPASGITSNAMFLGNLSRLGHVDGVPVVHESDGVAGDGGLRLLEQLLAAGEPGAG